MATNKRFEGEVIPVVATGTWTSGQPVLAGSLFGVAIADASSGDNVGLCVEGVFSLPKQGGAGVTFTQGAKVYFDGTNCTAVSSDAFIGIAQAAAVNADTSVNVLLQNGRASNALVADVTTMTSGTSAKTVTVGAVYDNKPVVVTVKAVGVGGFHATNPIVFSAAIASGTLTITALNAITGAATNVASNVVLHYAIAGSL